MEKIKNIFSGHHDDQQTSQSSNVASQPSITATHDAARDQPVTASHAVGDVSSHNNASGSSVPAYQSTGTLETDPEAKKHEHSVVRQILNPGGDKYDQEGYGITAHRPGEQGGAPYKAPVVADDVTLRTDDYEKKHEHSVLRQILNPGGAKYDQEGYGTTAHAVSDLPPSEQNKLETTPAAQKNEHGILRQILNPGGEKYDSQAHGVNADTVGHAAGVPGVAGTGAPAAHVDTASATSVKSGVHGPFDNATTTVGSASTAAHSTAAHSNVERDGALAGTALLVGSAAAPRLHRPEDDTALAVNPIGDDVAVTGTGVSHGQAVQNQFSEPVSHISHAATVGDNHQRGALALGTGPASINPIGDNTSVGTGVAHGQAIQGQHATGQYSSQEGPAAVTGSLQGETSSGLTHGQAVQRQYSGYIHQTQGPHPTDAGNTYDPSVPGSFPQSQDHTSAATIGNFIENRKPATGQATLSSARESPANTLDKTATSAGAAAAIYGTDNSLDPKTEQKLQHAREEVAAEGGDRGEKKPSLIQRILHPGQKSHETHGHEHVHHSHETPSSVANEQHQGPLLESRTAPEDIGHRSIGPQ